VAKEKNGRPESLGKCTNCLIIKQRAMFLFLFQKNNEVKYNTLSTDTCPFLDTFSFSNLKLQCVFGLGSPFFPVHVQNLN